jgi:hypothetical protein
MPNVHVPSADELRTHASQVRPQYARTPADALQCQIDAISLTEALRKTGVYQSLPGWLHDERNGIDDLRQFKTAPLYFWTARIAHVVEQASRSYPLQEQAFAPILPHAFCAFEQPVLWVVMHGVRAGLSALTWMTGIDEETGVVKLRVRGLVWTGGRCSVCFSIEIKNPRELPNPDGDPTFEDEARAVYRWICAASMFVEQRLTEESSAPVGRHVAKRAAHVSVSPTCHVIHMRRLDRRRHDETVGDGAAIDWQYQWLVRGHWRQQFYPSAGRHVPRWIAPYVKGPHDRPMKTPKPTVFVVQR